MSSLRSGCVPAAHLLTYNTAMNNLLELSLLLFPITPITSNFRGNDTIPLIFELVRDGSYLCSHHVLKLKEYGYQWRNIHDAGRLPFTPRRERWQEM